jgi:hypothetical protein
LLLLLLALPFTFLAFTFTFARTISAPFDLRNFKFFFKLFLSEGNLLEDSPFNFVLAVLVELFVFPNVFFCEFLKHVRSDLAARFVTDESDVVDTSVTVDAGDSGRVWFVLVCLCKHKLVALVNILYSHDDEEDEG